MSRDRCVSHEPELASAHDRDANGPGDPRLSRRSRSTSPVEAPSRRAATGSRSGCASSATRSRSPAASRSSSSSSSRSSARRSRRDPRSRAERPVRRTAINALRAAGRPVDARSGLADPGTDGALPLGAAHGRPRRVPAPALRRPGLARGRDPRDDRRRSSSASCSARSPATSAAGSTRSSRASSRSRWRSRCCSSSSRSPRRSATG